MKVALLHNGNKQPTVPIAYSRSLKETRETMKLILHKLNYDQHKWKICADLKVIGLLLGIKHGNCSYPCYLCLWNSRSRELHYTDHVWEKRPEKLEIDESRSIVSESLVNGKDVILPELHVRLGIGTQLIKALHADSKDETKVHSKNAMNRLIELFPLKKPPRINGGVFNGPEFEVILNDAEFEKRMDQKFRKALQALRSLRHGFFGNHKADNFEELVKNLVRCFNEIKANMNLKLHFLHNHLKDFAENLGDFSEQHGERFHQEIKTMEQRYGGKDYAAMQSDYCWFLIREADDYDTMWERDAKAQYFNINRK